LIGNRAVFLLLYEQNLPLRFTQKLNLPGAGSRAGKILKTAAGKKAGFPGRDFNRRLSDDRACRQQYH